MIYLELFLGFLKVGCFAFGGGYGAIPLIRDVVLSYGWLSDEMITYMVAVSESTPGPIMVNMATYVGSSQAGVFGAMIATFAVVFPSFVITILVAAILNAALKNPYFASVLQGVKPSIIGIILATGGYMIITNTITSVSALRINWSAIIITIILAACLIGYKHFKKKKLSPITLIIIAACLGIII